MRFLPRDFIVPTLLETDRCRLRPLTIHDVVKDYDAVMTSREHLWQMFGDTWGWPSEDLTLEQDLIDLGWHQKEFQLRSSFDYAVMSLDEKRVLGARAHQSEYGSFLESVRTQRGPRHLACYKNDGDGVGHAVADGRDAVGGPRS